MPVALANTFADQPAPPRLAMQQMFRLTDPAVQQTLPHVTHFRPVSQAYPEREIGVPPVGWVKRLREGIQTAFPD